MTTKIGFTDEYGRDLRAGIADKINKKIPRQGAWGHTTGIDRENVPALFEERHIAELEKKGWTTIRVPEKNIAEMRRDEKETIRVDATEVRVAGKNAKFMRNWIGVDKVEKGIIREVKAFHKAKIKEGFADILKLNTLMYVVGMQGIYETTFYHRIKTLVENGFLAYVGDDGVEFTKNAAGMIR